MTWTAPFFLNSILLGFGLAMDAFSVSLSNGLKEPAMKPLRIPVATDVNITFGFIVNALGSMVYGPVVALLGGAVSDTLGYLVSPNGVYFFPFILLEMGGSFIFALFLYSTDITPVRLILSKFCVNLWWFITGTFCT